MESEEEKEVDEIENRLIVEIYACRYCARLRTHSLGKISSYSYLYSTA